MEEAGPDSGLLPQAKECQFSHFLDLPLEIRLDIYELLLPHTNQVHEDDYRWVAGANPSILQTCKQIHQEASPRLYSSNTFCIRKQRDDYKIASLSNPQQADYPDWNFQGASNVLFESLNSEDIAMIESVVFGIPLSDKSVYRLSECEVDMIKFSLEAFRGVLGRMSHLQGLKVRITHRKERMGGVFCENDVKLYQLQQRATELLARFESLRGVIFYMVRCAFDSINIRVSLIQKAFTSTFEYRVTVRPPGKSQVRNPPRPGPVFVYN